MASSSRPASCRYSGAEEDRSTRSFDQMSGSGQPAGAGDGAGRASRGGRTGAAKRADAAVLGVPASVEPVDRAIFGVPASADLAEGAVFAVLPSAEPADGATFRLLASPALRSGRGARADDVGGVVRAGERVPLRPSSSLSTWRLDALFRWMTGKALRLSRRVHLLLLDPGSACSSLAAQATSNGSFHLAASSAYCKTTLPADRSTNHERAKIPTAALDLRSEPAPPGSPWSLSVNGPLQIGSNWTSPRDHTARFGGCYDGAKSHVPGITLRAAIGAGADVRDARGGPQTAWDPGDLGSR